MNAVAHGIDHIELGHGLGQERIAVAARYAITFQIVPWSTVKEAAFIFKHQSVGLLNHRYPTVARVVLMGNTVMQSFQHNFLIVLGDLNGQQFILGQQAQLDIADALIQLSGSQEQRRRKVLVGPFGPFQLPGHLCRMWRKVPDRLRFAQQQ